MEQFKNFKRELKKLEQLRANTKDTTSDKIAIMLQQDNIKKGLFDDTIEKVLEIWNKYKGKQLGERTKEKIQQEIEQHFNNNIFVYIYNGDYSYNTHITITTKDKTKNYNGDYKIQITTHDYKNKFLIDNQIQEITKEQAREEKAKDYIKNPQEQANKIIKLHEKAKQMQQELNKISHDIHELSNFKIDCVKYCSCVSSWTY